MLGLVGHRELEFSTVLMDTCYATKDLMVLIEEMGKTFYCPLKVNRLSGRLRRSASLPEGGLA